MKGKKKKNERTRRTSFFKVYANVTIHVAVYVTKKLIFYFDR